MHAKDFPAREETGLSIVDVVPDFEFDSVLVRSVFLSQVHDVLQVVFPVMVLVDVLVERDALFLE